MKDNALPPGMLIFNFKHVNTRHDGAAVSQFIFEKKFWWKKV
jgi:hypothetical protein